MKWVDYSVNFPGWISVESEEIDKILEEGNVYYVSVRDNERLDCKCQQARRVSDSGADWMSVYVPPCVRIVSGIGGRWRPDVML